MTVIMAEQHCGNPTASAAASAPAAAAAAAPPVAAAPVKQVAWGDDDDEEDEEGDRAIAELAASVAQARLTGVEKFDHEATINEEVYEGGPFPPRVTEFAKVPRMNPEVLQAIEKAGFRKPTMIQSAVLPFILQDPPKDLIAQARPDSGKTAAIMLAVILRCSKESGVQCIIVSNARELAIQNAVIAEKFSEFLALRVAIAVPDRYDKGKVFAEQIVSGTSQTLVHLVRTKKIESDKLQLLILDEADDLCGEFGQRDTTVDLLGLIKKNRKQNTLIN